MRLLWAIQKLFSIFSLVKILPFAIPVALFGVVYNQVYRHWLADVGSGSWEPAWPAGRTRLVFFMIAIPIWALMMALGMIAYAVVRSYWHKQKRGAAYEEVDLDPEDLNRTQGRSVRRQRYFYRLYRGHLSIYIYLLLGICGILLWGTYEQPADVRYRPDILRALKSPQPGGYGNGEKVFIGAMFHNSEAILQHWSDEIIKVIQYLGTDNVFVSIVDSYSGDDTSNLLKKLENQLHVLHVQNRILTDDTSIPRPNSMDTAIPRIQFLAATRNKVMEPLVEFGGYDRVVFSNDIFIESESILELLKTKDGNYDMACGVDLSFWGLYDAWVTRDRLGRLVSSLWPYLLEDTGMRAIMADEPAPVFSCWNGIVAFRADPFLPIHLRKSGRLSESPLSVPLPSSHPSYPQSANISPAMTPPLSFRHSEEGECFSSESFLLPYDFRRQFELNDIYLNPRVINSYDWNHYVWYKYVLRHWVVKWWIENVENGAGMHLAKMVVGDASRVWRWDGGECHPW